MRMNGSTDPHACAGERHAPAVEYGPGIPLPAGVGVNRRRRALVQNKGAGLATCPGTANFAENRYSSKTTWRVA